MLMWATPSTQQSLPANSGIGLAGLAIPTSMAAPGQDKTGGLVPWAVWMHGTRDKMAKHLDELPGAHQDWHA